MWNCRQTHDTVPRYIQVQCQTFNAPVIEGEKAKHHLCRALHLPFYCYIFLKVNYWCIVEMVVTITWLMQVQALSKRVAVEMTPFLLLNLLSINNTQVRCLFRKFPLQISRMFSVRHLVRVLSEPTNHCIIK